MSWSDNTVSVTLVVTGSGLSTSESRRVASALSALVGSLGWQAAHIELQAVRG